MSKQPKVSTSYSSTVKSPSQSFGYSASKGDYYSQYAYSIEQKIKEIELLIGLGCELQDDDRRHLAVLIKRLLKSLSN